MHIAHFLVWIEFEDYVLNYIKSKVRENRWFGSQGENFALVVWPVLIVSHPILGVLRSFFPMKIGWIPLIYHSILLRKFPSNSELATMMQKRFSNTLSKVLEWEPYLGNYKGSLNE